MVDLPTVVTIAVAVFTSFDRSTTNILAVKIWAMPGGSPSFAPYGFYGLFGESKYFIEHAVFLPFLVLPSTVTGEEREHSSCIAYGRPFRQGLDRGG